MKKYLFLISFLLGCWSTQSLMAAEEEPIEDVLNRGFCVSTQHALKMAEVLAPQKEKLPRTIVNGELATSTYSWWCSGFFPGVLWYLYENMPIAELKNNAAFFTARVERAKTLKNTHDLGFMLYCSFGNGYRLTGNESYKDVMLTGANSLASRYNPQLGLIRSWDFNANKWKYPVIIDNMMNLEFLMWASKVTGDDKYKEMAISHAKKTMENHFRKDYSCYHVVSYDPATGQPHVKQTHQGYSDDSAWARGQAWALYGYTMMYRETGDKDFLKQAQHIAKFLMKHPRMPKDKVPYWDFDAPEIPDTPRDASAAACMASALVELGQLVGGKEGAKYIDYAEDQIRTLTSPEYLAEPGSNCNFILKHSTGSYPGKKEVDVPLTYADYYYVEALTRLKKYYFPNAKPAVSTGAEDRKAWVDHLIKIADPLLTNLSQNTLKKNMAYESFAPASSRREFSFLESFGRLVCGIAPWLELGPDDTPEGQLREKYIQLTLKCLANSVNPSAPDYMDYDRQNQALVDAAFLAEGLLRAPTQLWGRMDKVTKERMITELKRSRAIRPNESNWLLFASTVEAALLEFTGECDMNRMLYGVKRFRYEWYKGDGIYGDGKEFHQDYYNSFVIHPMLTDVLIVMKKHNVPESDYLPKQKGHLSRYAAQLERMISPEGTYPAVGRSITYRFGAFHALSQAALLHCLPRNVAPAQVRCALTAVIKRQMKSPANFDKNGWLTVGFAGQQLHMAEYYINTGSEYLCSTGFLALGLPPTDPFWSEPFTAWTNLKAWNNLIVPADHSHN